MKIVRVAGASAEQLQDIYAPVLVSAAKARYLDLAIRHHGLGFLGADTSPDPKHP
ncbi:hypothetical protein ACFXHA_43115 [Nocardia sp. NPDC059240]|uniref:hypothetical protein n=1 Tax=Nocardia sp. NPDC059240 TaxID=3346786 RepID=UPI0036CBADA7